MFPRFPTSRRVCIGSRVGSRYHHPALANAGARSLHWITVLAFHREVFLLATTCQRRQLRRGRVFTALCATIRQKKLVGE
jgi:hypothetical protein